MATSRLIREAAWTGGGYGLGIVFRPPGTSAAEVSLAAIWKSEPVKGRYKSRDREPTVQPTDSPKLDAPHLYGVVAVADVELPCSSTLMRLESEDWLYFTIPMGAIYDVFNVDGLEDEPALETLLSSWFLARAQELASIAPCVPPASALGSGTTLLLHYFTTSSNR